MKKTPKLIKEFFTFSKGERRGALVLIALILLLILFNFLYPLFIRQKQYDHSAFDSEVKLFLEEQELIDAKNKTDNQKEDFDILDMKRSVVENKLNPFPFDPNTLTHEQWLKLGLSDNEAKMIEKYRSKGGKFYDKQDFKKMYCISADEYQVLEPFIEIKLPKPEYPKDNYQKKEIIITKTEINSASIDEFIKIKGIGNYFATQIVNYRIKLGGYYMIEQLLEIPKMDTLKFNPLIPYIEVNANAIRKININKADFEQLKSHPYIGYNIALSLINYRAKHGFYNLVSDIKKSMLITDKNYYKISQYLCVE